LIKIGYIRQANFSGIAPFQNSSIGLKTSTPGLPGLGETFFSNDPPLKFPYALVYKIISRISDLQGLGTIDSITYIAVTEPDAWALLIAGSAVAGAALRIRRRVRRPQSLDR
jgi:hypothetical protein